MTRRITRTFYRNEATELARALLGHLLVRKLESGQVLSGRIVETEAYLGITDRASHSFGGRRTKRNNSMWLDGGHVYVYFIYGMHWCFNIVSAQKNEPSACLIRAIEPVTGLNEIYRRRGNKKETDLCSGPAKLTKALAIDGSLDGEDLMSSDKIFLRLDQPLSQKEIGTGPRIGVEYAKEWAAKPLRFFALNSAHLSQRRKEIIKSKH